MLFRFFKSPTDILLERDTMHSALTGLDTHTHTDNGMKLVNAGYRAMLETAKDLNGQFIFVSGAATQEQRQPFIDAGAEMRLIYADRQTCLTRARAERHVREVQMQRRGRGGSELAVFKTIRNT